jgi:hypothetical protein
MNDDPKKLMKEFEQLMKEFNQVIDSTSSCDQKSNNEVSETKTITINLAGKRVKTFFNLIGCAFEILIKNKTSLKIRKLIK